MSRNRAANGENGAAEGSEGGVSRKEEKGVVAVGRGRTASFVHVDARGTRFIYELFHLSRVF